MRFFLLAAMMLYLASSVFAATIHVPGNHANIQDAINSASNGDTVLVDPGVYFENLNFLGKAIHVTSSGGVAATIIDGSQNGSVVTFTSKEGADSMISGFTLKNGSGTKVSELWNKYCGGGIYCDKASSPTIKDNIITLNETDLGGGVLCNGDAAPKILNNTIQFNKADRGGGIYTCSQKISPEIKGNEIKHNHALNSGGGICCEGSSPQIKNNKILFNDAELDGGGIFCTTGAPAIEDNIISGNNADDYPDSFGGGICADNSNVLIKNNIFNTNHSNAGGAISCTGPGKIVQNTISMNHAYLKGAGVCAFLDTLISDNVIFNNKIIAGNGSGGGICAWGNPTITGNTVYNNDGGYFGGGIKVEDLSNACVDGNRVYDNVADIGAGICCDVDSSPLVRNNVIYGNIALNDGGGLMCRDNCAMIAVNNTIVKNSAGWYGAGITCANCSPQVINSIVRDNTAPNHKDIKGAAVVSYSNVEAGWSGPGNIDADPQFADPSAHDYHILFTSPCKDAGDSATPHLPDVDYENDPRPAFSAADMGADEFYNHIYATGSFKPSSNIDVKVMGPPSTWPVGFWVGFDLYANPIPTEWGDWYLKFPILGPFVLFPIPSNGMAKLSAVMPPNTHGLTFYLHALVGGELSNTHKVEIKL